MLITFANSFEPDQAQRYVKPDLDPNCLTLGWYRKNFSKKVDFEKKSVEVKNALGKELIHVMQKYQINLHHF